MDLIGSCCCVSFRAERSPEEEASDEGETPAGGQHLQRHGHLEHRDPASLGLHVRLHRCVCVCARVLVFIYIVCVQEGNEAGQRAVVAGPSPQRQRKSLEPRYRQRAEHHTRYKHAILDTLLTLLLNIKYIFKCCSDCSCLFKPP